MSIQAVLLPLFVQLILTFVLLYWMGYLRSDCFKTGAVKARDIALREPNWPPRAGADAGWKYRKTAHRPALPPSPCGSHRIAW